MVDNDRDLHLTVHSLYRADCNVYLNFKLSRSDAKELMQRLLEELTYNESDTLEVSVECEVNINGMGFRKPVSNIPLNEVIIM